MNRLHAMFFCLVLTVASGRQARQAGPAERYGYIVVGPVTAAEYGFKAGDTLTEIPRDSAPKRVSAAAGREASRIRYLPKCTRYFVAQDIFLALLEVSCTEGEVVDDGQSLAAFDAEGNAVGRSILWLPQGSYSALSPEARPAPQGVPPMGMCPDTLVAIAAARVSSRAALYVTQLPNAIQHPLAPGPDLLVLSGPHSGRSEMPSICRIDVANEAGRDAYTLAVSDGRIYRLGGFADVEVTELSRNLPPVNGAAALLARARAFARWLDPQGAKRLLIFNEPPHDRGETRVWSKWGSVHDEYWPRDSTILRDDGGIGVTITTLSQRRDTFTWRWEPIVYHMELGPSGIITAWAKRGGQPFFVTEK